MPGPWLTWGIPQGPGPRTGMITRPTPRGPRVGGGREHTMQPLAIKTNGLTRRFGEIVAVENLTLGVPLGGVVGVVGPNGSGKSTTLRMLLELIHPSSGTAEVRGPTIADPSRFAHRVGALIESPAFVPTLSAHRNLASLAKLQGLPAGRVDEVLRIVELTDHRR